MQEKEDNFSIFIPLEIEKSGKSGEDKYQNMKFKGIASTTKMGEDSDGEILEPSGFDISDMVTNGQCNWHHLWTDKPSAIIGEPTKAEIRDNELYIEGRLYPSSAKAREVYDLAETLEKDSPTRRLGFSIEGRSLLRDPKNKNRILKSRIKNVAITPMPKCKGTKMEIMKGLIQDQEFEFMKSEQDGNGGTIDYIIDVVDHEGNRRTVDKYFNIKTWDDVEKGGPGSGRHTIGSKVKYKKGVESDVYRNGIFTIRKHLNSNDPDKIGYSLSDDDGNTHSAQHRNLEKINKAMVAGSITGRDTTDQLLTQQPLKKESVEGVKKKKKKKDEDDDDNNTPLSKGQAILALLDEGYDVESAVGLYELAVEVGDINKAKGEGSRGGKVIGHTRTGKPVYNSEHHDSYKHFNRRDHNDAAYIHGKAGNREIAQKHDDASDAEVRAQRDQDDRNARRPPPKE